MPDRFSSPESGDRSDGYVGRRRRSSAAPIPTERRAEPETVVDSLWHDNHEGERGYAGRDMAGSRQQYAEHAPAYDDAERTLLAGVATDEYDDEFDDYDEHPPIFRDREPARGRSRRRGNVLIALVAGVLVAALALGGAMMLRGVLDRGGGVKDYTGEGSGSASVVVNSGDSLTQIAATLAQAGVIARPAPFISAARANPSATSIQPGTYTMRQQMSGVAALTLMLDPASRNVIKVTIPEGYRIDQVRALLIKELQAPPDQVDAALADIAALGIPADFGQVTSAEGFLYPATYDFQPGTTPATALRAMVQAFTDKIATTGFVAKARAQGVTAYQALILASMAEAEATNAADWAKVSRVIYNRLQQQMPLGIDSTSVYEARLKGTDPMQIDYQVPTPYNTRLEPGLPPTPIGSPGDATLTAAVVPAAGDWLYYVQTDAAGTLSFTNDYSQFQAWAQTCQQNSWGNC